MSLSKLTTLSKFSLGLGSLLVALAACGEDVVGSEFGDGVENKSNGVPGGSGSIGGQGEGANGGGAGQGGGGGDNPALAACATSSAAAEPRPVYLVVMFDRSGSMVQNSSPKWSACKAATQAFFSSPASAGVSASLHYFPQGDPATPSCSKGTYASPAVAMTALPNTSFNTSLDTQTPAGNTPTEPALSGAVEYAKTVAQAQGKDGTVAVVLVTDGEPNVCNSDTTGVTSIAAAASSDGSLPILTYVIGVGAVSSLNQIAKGGGTKQAFVVATDNPQQIEQDFRTAIETIKLSAIACDYKIPAAPQGAQLDHGKVNVVHTPTGAAASNAYVYNPLCTGGNGWRYDSTDNPSRIVFCDVSCNDLKTRPGKVDIVFGCATRTPNVK